MCLDRFLLLKVSRFSFLSEFTCIQFCRLRQKSFYYNYYFYKNYKNAASLFYSYTNYSALNLSMKFRNIPKTHKLFFYGCMLLRTNTNQGWQRLFISVDRLFMTIFKSFAFVPSLFVDQIKAFEMPHLVKISLD